MATKQVGLAPSSANDAVTKADLDTKVGSTDIFLMTKMTQAAYDALTPKVSTTIYVITGA